MTNSNNIERRIASFPETASLIQIAPARVAHSFESGLYREIAQMLELELK
jgi:hypothetical protein